MTINILILDEVFKIEKDSDFKTVLEWISEHENDLENNALVTVTREDLVKYMTLNEFLSLLVRSMFVIQAAEALSKK